ncbi:MAG: hypothetical protein LQ340_004239 [Diploschistes diacapsis]|nr:MAG: hypothetical protein LQ340_004239 [Diploschistes diacapsis]
MHWTKDYDLNDPTAIREALHREYREWAAEYHAVIDAVNPASIEPRVLYQLPIGIAWENKASFTVIDNAVHLMSPFASKGVNCAMTDACELAVIITKALAAEVAKGRDGLAPYVAQFEMRTRTAPIQQLAWLPLDDLYYNPGAPRNIVKSFVICNVQQIGWYFRVPVTIVAYIYFFFVKRRVG